LLVDGQRAACSPSPSGEAEQPRRITIWSRGGDRAVVLPDERQPALASRARHLGAGADLVRRLLRHWCPAVQSARRVKREEASAPMILLAAALELPGAVRGEQAARWLRPIVVDALPSPEAVVGGVQPVRLAAGVVRSRLELELPEGWSLAAAEPVEAEAELGRFTLEVSLLERRLRVESELELRRSLIEPEQLPSLRALALAESRAEAYRVRLLCPTGTP
jgi:hypothetical protein